MDERTRTEVEASLGNLISGLDDETRTRIIDLVIELLESARHEERALLVSVCRHRARLWQSTDLASSNVPPAREEARARANEARYIADFVESGEDLYPEVDA